MKGSWPKASSTSYPKEKRIKLLLAFFSLFVAFLFLLPYSIPSYPYALKDMAINKESKWKGLGSKRE